MTLVDEIIQITFNPGQNSLLQPAGPTMVIVYHSGISALQDSVCSFLWHQVRSSPLDGGFKYLRMEKAN